MQNNLTDSTDNLLSTGANNVGQTKKRQSYHHRANKPAQKVLSANTSTATNLKPNPVASQKPLRNNRTQAPKQNQTNRSSAVNKELLCQKLVARFAALRAKINFALYLWVAVKK
jgi:hypothetical protein